MPNSADLPAAGRSPLSGLAVIEAIGPDAPASLALAAGLAGRVAADLGADVTRLLIDDEVRPEDAFLHLGKRTVVVSSAEWSATLADLLPQATAVICDSGVERAGTNFGATLPVILGMSRDTPLAGSELTLEARSGLLDMVGDPGQEPLRLGGHQTAYAGGLAAYLALVTALVRRQAGEASGPVRVNLLDVAVWLNWKTLGMAARTGAAPHRLGQLAEWIVVACTDGHAALVYRANDWERLLEALGDARLSAPRFATASGRADHRAELNAILTEAFSQLSRAKVHELAIRSKLPLGPVWAPGELLNDAQMLARGFFRPTDDGAALVPSLPAVWNGVRPPQDIPATAHPVAATTHKIGATA